MLFFFSGIVFLLLSVSAVSTLALFHRQWIQNESQELETAAQSLEELLRPLSGRANLLKIFESKTDYQVQIWDSAGLLVFQTKEAPDLPQNLIRKSLQQTVMSNHKDFLVRTFKSPKNGLTVVLSEDLDVYLEQEEALTHLLLFITIICSLVSCLVGWFFAWSALAPIRHITQKTQNISLKNLSQRLPVVPNSKDEIQQLAKTLNQMLTRLEQSAKTLKNFIQNASHELKTPIAIVGTTLELAESKKDYTKITTARTELKKMDELINKLLFMSKNEILGKKALTLNKIELEPLVKRELATFEKQFRLQNFDYQVVIPSKTSITADSVAFEIILKNLLGNAHKFTPSGGKISLVYKNGQLEITNSIASEPKDIDAFFSPFYQGSHGKQNQGYGLGLAIVKQLVEAQGWKISVSSKPNSLSFLIQF